MELTRQDRYPPLIRDLAESFGMMLVQVEAREFHLEQMIDELAVKNKQIEATLKKVRLLESIRDQLSKFVPSSVKSLIEKNPENPDLEKRDEDVTVLFLDIAGYTRLSEQINHEQVTYLIQTYFSSFLDVIFVNEGDITETAGDGLMILFRDPKGGTMPPMPSEPPSEFGTKRNSSMKLTGVSMPRSLSTWVSTRGLPRWDLPASKGFQEPVGPSQPRVL